MTKTCVNCKVRKIYSEFYKRKDGKNGYTSECKVCFRIRMGQRHQRHKILLVAEFGGKCNRCDYSKDIRALVFHHINPATKSFGISNRLSTSLKILRKEADKCILLCPNCHAEKHLGLW